jgi:hypothetical protein
MIEKNVFLPLDEWCYPIWEGRIDIYEETEGTQWDAHLNLKHNLENFVSDKIYPFII